MEYIRLYIFSSLVSIIYILISIRYSIAYLPSRNVPGSTEKVAEIAVLLEDSLGGVDSPTLLTYITSPT